MSPWWRSAPYPDETEKTLVGSALAGHPIIASDNCRDTLSGDFLCQVTERPLLQLRALGKSDKIRVANTFTTFANGNNVAVADDLVRRTICCALDANVENPECRTFAGDPLAPRSGAIAAHTSPPASPSRAPTSRPASPIACRRWPAMRGGRDIVRSPLVWLGYADPVATMAAARSADPVRQDRARAFEAWRDELGFDRMVTASELIELAEERRSYGGELAHATTHAILIGIAEKRGAAGKIEPRRLGKWLTANENTIAAGLKLTVDRADKSRVRYRLRPA